MGVRDMGLPERIGRYEIVAELASGGMAEILLARLVGPSGFERPVVIKRILPHLAREASFVDMFLDEARIVAGIVHPNVVQVQELGQDGTELFLAMEYLEGESTSGLIKRLVSRDEALDPLLAAHIVAQACAGLHAAHELVDDEGIAVNLVHRDVSPQNIFVTYGGQVKVLDFGIAKAADRITRTETGVIKGKHEYMSPEQCLGKPLDRRSDVFALGVVLYELIAAKRLFKRSNQMATLHAICEEPVPPLREVAPRVDPELAAICMRALARQREARFATAADMRKELLARLHKLGGGSDLAETLGTLMKRVFADRIEDKREMLRRVRAGSALTHVPRGEVDLSVDIPLLTNSDRGHATGTTVSRWEKLAEGSAEKTRRTRRRLAIGVSALAVLGALAVGATRMRPWAAASKPPANATADPPAPPPSAPAETASAPPAATSSAAPDEVVIHVESTPSGADVLVAGTDRGVTPIEVRLPRGAGPVSLELHHSGFTTLTQSLVPDGDQRILVALTSIGGPRRAPRLPTRSSATPAPKPTEAPPAPASASPGFTRFE